MVLVVVGTLALFISGCGEPQAYGKVDKTPYEIRECNQELYRGIDTDPDKHIDKIVVYKKKRKLSPNLFTTPRILYWVNIQGDK